MDYFDIHERFMRDGIVKLNTGTEFANIYSIKKILSNFGKKLDVGRNDITDENWLQLVSETAMFGSEYLHWHTDQSYSLGNYHGTLLAYNFSDYPTYTEFADMKIAYNELSDEYKTMYSKMTCFYKGPQNSHRHVNSKLSSDQKTPFIGPPNRMYMPVGHPLICVHPITKSKSIYFNPLAFSHCPQKLDVEDLVIHCEKYTFKHHWRPGDIVLWDNRVLMHRRPAFKGKRQLFRVNFRYE